jgi:hypothetical protein
MSLRIPSVDPNWRQPGVEARCNTRSVLTVKRIVIAVALIYYLSSLFVYRGIAASIPSILDGTAVLNGDEMVPFFNPTSQLFDQAAGKFNHLTNGYEFRVRYSFLTTWMRYYKILPFAIILVIPSVTFLGFLAVSKFLSSALTNFAATDIYIATAAPVALIFLILAYTKITHFYTLILGFSLFLLASVLLTYGLIFAERRPYRLIAASCIVTLLNPAVHYLVLFAIYLSITVAALLLLEAVAFLRSDWLRRLISPQSWLRWLGGLKTWLCQRVRPRARLGGLDTPHIVFGPRTWSSRLARYGSWPRLVYVLKLRPLWPAVSQATITRCVVAFVLLICLALVPYGLFVKYVALRGVPNLSETVPGDFYFITDASIPFIHMLSWDMAGIMDKYIGGDYLSKDPRTNNIIYSVLLLLPLVVPKIRRQVFNTRRRQAFMFAAYLNVFFSMWATLGYSNPAWAPTFHRVLALISRTAYDSQSSLGDLVLKLTSTIVQVLRFPHRFQLILFMMACMLMPVGLVWIGRALRQRVSDRAPKLARLSIPMLAMVFLVPLFSNWEYRDTFSSGNYINFLAPYPVTALREVKDVLQDMPPGKVVVLPPTETAKVIVDSEGVEHKFIDKFHIYYLDLPSFYYGLTGDSDNKFEFFLLLRALYYQQDWWINIARDVGIRYIVINKELIGNTVGGAEYLRGIEKLILPEMDELTDYLRPLYENDGYAVYEMIDLPKAERPALWIDTDWNTFIQVLSSRPDLSRYYDLRYAPVSDDLTDFENLTILSDNPMSSSLDLYVKSNQSQFSGPSSSIFAFEPDVIPSSYYLSPMFRLFQFFSDSKWNRLNMITPGLFGTVRGSFVGFPRSTKFRIDAKFPEDGTYRLMMRSAASANSLSVRADSIGYKTELVLTAPEGALSFYDQETVFEPGRQPVDISQYSLDELGRLIPSDIVAVNYRYQYYDLGVVEATKGNHTLYFDKHDDNPLLMEGILVIPEETYTNLSVPENTILLESQDELCCTLPGREE